MNIAVLGTGVVGRSHAERLAGLGHRVTLGTQDVEKTLTETKPDMMGNPPFSVWHKDHKDVTLQTFSDATKAGELVINALRGDIAENVLVSVKTHLENKVLIDIANPLDFSKGFPPSLSVCNTDSLGEQIQRALPETRVVKIFNTVNASLQTNPAMLMNGDHTLFVAGNDADAKQEATRIAKEEYGWKHIIDLGDITNARGMEMMLPIWLRLFGALGTAMFNYKIVMNEKQ